MVNDAFYLWSHKYVYDVGELQKILSEIGFSTVTEVAWRKSKNPTLKGLERRPFHGEIILEATKA